MFTKILLATDGSENSLRAAKEAKELALKFNSKVTILYVGQIPIMNLLSYHGTMIKDPILPEDIEKQIEKNAKKSLELTAEIFSDTNLVVEEKFMFGNPEETIMDLAKEENYGIIVMGRRGISGLNKYFLGTVSDRVAHFTPCSLLIVN